MWEEYKYLFHSLIQWSQEDNDKYVQTVDRLYIFLHAYMDDCDIQYLNIKKNHGDKLKSTFVLSVLLIPILVPSNSS